MIISGRYFRKTNIPNIDTPMAKTDDIISLTELFKLSKTGVKIKKQKRITINQFRCVLIDIFFLFPEM